MLLGFKDMKLKQNLRESDFYIEEKPEKYKIKEGK